MNYQKKVKAISRKGLTKDLINKFSIHKLNIHFFFRNISKLFNFIPVKKYIKYFSGTTRINSWKSNEISEENIKDITKSDSNFAPTFVDHHLLPDINLHGHCLINNNFSIHKKLINLYISYELSPWSRDLNTILH